MALARGDPATYRAELIGGLRRSLGGGGGLHVDSGATVADGVESTTGIAAGG